MITLDITTYLDQIDEQRRAALKVMQGTAAKLHNDLSCGATCDTQRYLNDIQKALDVYDECIEEKAIILRAKEKGSTRLQLRLQDCIIKAKTTKK